MLPFPKRNYRDEIVELDDEDLVEVAPPSSVPVQRAAAPQRVERPSRPPFSRRVSSPDLEDDVVGECLASISASTTRGRSLTPLTLPSPPASRRSVPPSSSSMLSAARLPAVMPPPFVRTAVRTSEPSLFARTPAPPSSSSSAASLPPSPVVSSVSSIPSIAPSASSIRPEPTVILVRERPRAGWMVGAAVIGAACAIIVTRLLTAPSSAPSPAQVVAAPAPPPPVPTQVVVPSTPQSTAPQPSATAPAVALTVKFNEDDAVAIPAPSSSPSGAPAPTHAPPAAAPAASFAAAPKPKPKAKPAAVTGPTLPDGSLTLGPAASGQASGPLAPVRKFTPDQELAAAQLKAASK